MSVNQKCNTFQSVLSIFLHANNTPEKVSEVLSRMGVSVLMTAIYDAIDSLSNNAKHTVQQLSQTLTAAYAYDNFDVDLKTWKPMIKSAAEPSLKHLTSGLLFPLPRSISKEDLWVSEWLWRRSCLNNQLPNSCSELAPAPDFLRLLQIPWNPQYMCIDGNGMTCRDRWNAWKFLHDLIHHGPIYFLQFK